MGRDSWRYRKHEEERLKKKRMNPLWRGVGCFMAVVFLLGGYFFADWFLYANLTAGWVPIPMALLAPPQLPWLPAGAAVKIVVGLLFMMLSYGVFSTLYAIAFPVEPGETDSPPLKRTGPPRRR